MTKVLLVFLCALCSEQVSDFTEKLPEFPELWTGAEMRLNRRDSKYLIVAF